MKNSMYVKWAISVLGVCGLSVLPVCGQTTTCVKEVKIGGFVGGRIDDCINHRVKTQDVDHLVEPFKKQNETRLWQSEFWGKWILGAISSYQYTKDPELKAKITYAAEGLMKTQLPNGYIGNYAADAQLQHWDIWGRKYSLLGLIAYYDMTGDERALTAGRKVVDNLLTQVGEGRADIVKTGNYRGMPSSSILEPVMFLYNRTKDAKYLDFAKYIVAQWETPDGPKLISMAVENVPVSQRFPQMKSWWSWENGQKAYEMMSCYEGLLELYKVTGEPLYLDVVERVVNNIIAEEINIAGSGSAFECWYGGRAKQTQPTYHTMETCVTFTWIKLCNTLLNLTGKSLYADQIERSAYNALIASLKGDASQIAKYSPLEGVRHEGEEQCGMHINCCNANGPRAFALLPQFAYAVTGENNIAVNLYTSSSAVVQLANKNSVKLTQNTDYPVTDRIEITVDPSKESEFAIALRIPQWSEINTLKVNGVPERGLLRGTYYTVARKWKAGDKVELTLDLRARLLEMNNAQAIVRGPVVLARDSRFNDGDVDEAAIIENKNGIVDLKLAPNPAPFAWFTFYAPVVLGTDLEGREPPKQIAFCDFGSAGNSWDKKQRYRVWLPKTLNVMKMDYSTY